MKEVQAIATRKRESERCKVEAGLQQVEVIL